MRTEQRVVLFVVLSIAMMLGMQILFDKLGLTPRPRKPDAAEAVQAEPEKAANEKAAKVPETPKAEPKAEAKPKPAPTAQIPVIPPDRLVLGSARPQDGYPIELRLEQRGAGVASLVSSRIEAEYIDGKKPQNRPLHFIEWDPTVPPSFAMAVVDVNKQPANDEDAARGGIEIPTDVELWEVVPDVQGRYVRPLKDGQELRFRKVLADLGVTLTKTYRLRRGQDGFEFELGFEGTADRTLKYRLNGPHGIPIEGDWYTTTFRDVFLGLVNGDATKVETLPAYQVVGSQEKPEKYTALPLKFAGVENQYFAVFLEPDPLARSRDQSWEDESFATVIHETTDKQRSDVTVEILSKKFQVGPNQSLSHRYRVFAGTKNKTALKPYGAEELSRYRKGFSLGPLGDLGASTLATYVITPMLKRIYGVTQFVSSVFGGRRGNYGIAIILLTMTVRLILLPLGRKQAKMAKQMQDLQPHLQELKEKYKDDKEAITRETLKLYKEHGANPMAGCLPALIQLPILIGLWQALNNSVELRHSSFLWITNLAAPDMLFRFPVPIPKIPSFIPLIGGWWIGPYFNVLPLVVVGLMMVQTKLFSPPAVTEEQKAQQSMMKFMMVFMMFMFYKVPSGLGIYFITSSLWQLGERLLLPKPKTAAPAPPSTRDEDEDHGGGRGRGGPGGKGHGGPNGNGAKGWLDQARERLEAIVQEAQKDKTHRNVDRDRDRGKTRPKPGRRK